MKEIEFLESELDKQIGIFDTESKKHKNLFRKLRYFTYAFTGLSTLLAGIAIGSRDIQEYLNMGVVVSTVAVGMVSAIEGLRKPNELWIMERNMYYALIDLKRALEFDRTRDKKVNVKSYFNQLQQLLNAAGEKWNKRVKNPLPKEN